MKLLLTSEGFTTDAIIQAAIRLVGKDAQDINVAVINEGYIAEPGDHRSVLDDMNHVAAIFGGDFELVNLLALEPAAILTRLQAADLIFVLGGHQDYLMNVFNRSGLSRLLPELLQTKVYVGLSAGSMVMGQRLSSDAYYGFFGEEASFGEPPYSNIVDFAMVPHLGSPLHPGSNAQAVEQAAHNFAGTVYGLPDDSALVVEDGRISVLGDGVIQFENGQPK